MTKEEAIRRLFNIERCTPIHTREDVRDFEALEMAIKALEQDPLTEEDYIELHDRFGDYVEFVIKDMVSGKGERWTKNNPQEPKTGRWIKKPFIVNGIINGAQIQCSECLNEKRCPQYRYENLYEYEKYCSNCGARMVEPQEGSEK